jgi:hypothetical protein
VGFHSFWDVYNQLRPMVDAEFLFQSNIHAVNQDRIQDNTSVGSNSEDTGVPLHHLRACEFGQDGIPAANYVEYNGKTSCSLPFSLSDAPPSDRLWARRGRTRYSEFFIILLLPYTHTPSRSDHGSFLGW